MIKRKQFPQFLAPYCIALEKSVGAIVFRVKQDKMEFLLMKYRGGHWEFPRGRIEQNETEYETMKREIEEETGISQLRIVEGFRESIRFSYKANGKELINRKKDKNCIFVHKKVIFYLAEAMEKKVIISHEHQQFQWLRCSEAIEKTTFKAGKNVLKCSCEYLKKINYLKNYEKSNNRLS